MTDRLTDSELVALRRLNTLAQEAALAVEEATTAARRAQQVLQNYIYQLESDHGWLGRNPQINISGAVKFDDQEEQEKKDEAQT